MKKAFKICALAAISLVTLGSTSCGGKKITSSGSTSSSGGNASSSGSIEPVGPDYANADLILNFYRFDENYANWGAWIWGNDLNIGLVFDTSWTRTFNETGDWTWVSFPITYGRTYTFYSDWNFTTTVDVTLTAENFDGVIIRDTVGNKDVSSDRNFDMSKVDANGVLNTYFITGNANIFYSLAEVPTSPVKDVYFKDEDEIVVSNYYTNNDLKAENISIKDSTGKQYGVEYVTSSGTDKIISLSEKFSDVTKRLVMTFDGIDYPISFKMLYNSKDFNNLYQYDGLDLGATVVNNITTFKLWSPAATDVKLNLYSTATSTEAPVVIDMVKGEKGVWATTQNTNLHAHYYNYKVTVYGTTSDVADPYAASSNANGVRSMVVDWSQISGTVAAAPTVKTPADVSVYETHVRDFSMHDSWKGTAANKGKYLGLIESGLKLESGEAIGFDYVKDLGVSHIQLLPVYDFNSVDETKVNDADYAAKHRNGVYNWGYDPYSYASLEGSYSSDPNDGLTRINEFRQVTDAYNKAGVGVIMDVVYNHMPSESSSTYNKIMPDYYFRTNSYSGAGSDIASENAMVRNMIVQTTRDLATHYNLAGFRFDLMGLIAKNAMQAVSKSLTAIDEDILLYGEGWTMYGGDPYLGNKAQSTQGSLAHIEKDKEAKVGYFNDTFRDGMKGNVFNELDKGFLQIANSTLVSTVEDEAKLETLKQSVLDGISNTKYKNYWANHYAGVSVNYAEAHDNLTLHDKLYMTNPEASEEERNAVQALANQIIALSSGISFYHSGTEFARSKSLPLSWLEGEDKVTEKYSCIGEGEDKVCFVNDSYNFSDEINAIDWTLINTNASMVSSFKDALVARNSDDLALMKPAELSDLVFTNYETADEIGLTTGDMEKILAYSFSSKAAEGDVTIIINTSGADIVIDETLITNKSITINYNLTSSSSSYTIPANGVAIIK